MTGLALAVAVPVGAQDARALQAASLAATCSACHGTAGQAVQGASVPGLAARPANELRDAMRAFRAGTRPGTIMPQLAKGYDDAQVDRLAAWFAAQPAPVRP